MTPRRLAAPRKPVGRASPHAETVLRRLSGTQATPCRCRFHPVVIAVHTVIVVALHPVACILGVECVRTGDCRNREQPQKHHQRAYDQPSRSHASLLFAPILFRADKARGYVNGRTMHRSCWSALAVDILGLVEAARQSRVHDCPRLSREQIAAVNAGIDRGSTLEPRSAPSRTLRQITAPPASRRSSTQSLTCLARPWQPPCQPRSHHWDRESA